jgi:hypothetical protein
MGRKIDIKRNISTIRSRFRNTKQYQVGQSIGCVLFKRKEQMKNEKLSHGWFHFYGDERGLAV